MNKLCTRPAAACRRLQDAAVGCRRLVSAAMVHGDGRGAVPLPLQRASPRLQVRGTVLAWLAGSDAGLGAILESAVAVAAGRLPLPTAAALASAAAGAARAMLCVWRLSGPWLHAHSTPSPAFAAAATHASCLPQVQRGRAAGSHLHRPLHEQRQRDPGVQHRGEPARHAAGVLGRGFCAAVSTSQAGRCLQRRCEAVVEVQCAVGCMLDVSCWPACRLWQF